jgi:hypothetical protein
LNILFSIFQCEYISHFSLSKFQLVYTQLICFSYFKCVYVKEAINVKHKKEKNLLFIYCIQFQKLHCYCRCARLAVSTLGLAREIRPKTKNRFNPNPFQSIFLESQIDANLIRSSPTRKPRQQVIKEHRNPIQPESK